MLLTVGLALARAADSSANQEIVTRYEQILEREPVEGPSFDKLIQLYEEGEGLEKLDQRWAPLAAEPGDKGATYSLLRGFLADHQGKTDDARRFFQSATQARPDDYHGWLALGDFESRQGKWTDAINALQKGLATKVSGDDRLSFYRKLGQAQERNLDTPAALATWQKMVEEFPKDPYALEEAGNAELDAEQFDEARKTFQKLVDLREPNSMNRVQALMHLAEVDDRQGKTDAAVHDYEAILPQTAESSWLNRELRSEIEQIYRRQDDLAGLVAYYKTWSEANPHDVEALLLWSHALDELGKKPEALDALRKAAALAPDRHEVRQSLALGLVEAKQYDEAIKVLTALTADDPTEPRYWDTMGEALWLKTQPPTPESKKAVLEAWQKIAPPDSKDVAAIIQVGDICHEHGLNDEALAYYQRALALAPDGSDIREKAVKLLVEMKRPDDAWKLLDQMVDGTGATAANYLKLAKLQGQFGRKEATMDSIQKGLALEPNNFDLLTAEWGQLAEAQKWPEAIALYDRLIAAAPNDYFVDQIESRHLQALTSAGKLDETSKNLRAKLGADPGLNESELGLLIRIMIPQSDPDLTKVFDEAHKRFPQSIGLMRLEVDYDRHVGNFDGAVAILQKLADAMPQQKSDWLTEIVHVRIDQGKNDAALQTAQQIIDASPANASGYLLYADTALAMDRADDAVTKLQAAIKLSDKPNDVRQRLARYYLETGQAGKARGVYDDAFTAAETPQDKLSIVKAMIPAYFQDGAIETLIGRFKKQQSSEEGGWRYGLYLSAIYEQMQDYGSARREVAKSLAVRPNDTALLKSLIGLADKEGDKDELLKYREMLAAVDPSPNNEVALANEYASQQKPEEAWRIVQKNSAEVAKDPMAWKDVLTQVNDPKYAGAIKAILEEAIRSQGNTFSGKLALTQFQMQQNDLDGAKATLWEILATPLPSETAPQTPAATTSQPRQNPLISLYQGPFFVRMNQTYIAQNEAQMLMSANLNSGQRRIVNMIRTRYNSLPGAPAATSATSIKDRALVYLSVIALQEKNADDFLKDLETKLAEWHWSLPDRIMTYAIIQAEEPLLAAIEEQARSTQPDKGLDMFCYVTSGRYLSADAGSDMAKRASDAQKLLLQRMDKNSALTKQMAMMQIYQLNNQQNPLADVTAKKKALAKEYFDSVDSHDPDDLLSAINVANEVGDWVEIKKDVTALAATDHAKWSAVTTQQMSYLPLGLLNRAATTKEIMPKEVVPIIVDLWRMSYPTVPPTTALMGGTQRGISGLGNYIQNMFPPPNRYFPADRMQTMEPIFQQLKARDLVPAMYAALDAQKKELNDWRQIYPTLLEIYFQWWDGKRDEATASVRKLIEQNPSDDFRLLLASMLTMQQKYDEAIPVLESVSARYGPDYIRTQLQLLHIARMAKNNEMGQKAAQRLLSMRLPQQDQLQMVDDLRSIGLVEKADDIVKKNSIGRQSPSATTMQADQKLLQSLAEAMGKNDEPKALEIARQVLNRDPQAAYLQGNGKYLRDTALNALKNFGQLDAYVTDIEKQLEATPDSLRLNWLAGEAYQVMDDRFAKQVSLAPFPQWLKVQRTGKQFEGFYSLDGTTWVEAGSGQFDLPAKLDVGVWIASRIGKTPLTAKIDQIAFTGKVAPVEAPVASPAPVVPDTTNGASVASAPATIPLEAVWQQTDLIRMGKLTAPGAATGSTSSGLSLTGGLEDPKQALTGRHYVYQTLEGDGALVVRVADFSGAAQDGDVGIMMRDQLDDTASQITTLALNPATGVRWETREQGTWKFTMTKGLVPPAWLKLARKGNAFTCSYSRDGQQWIELFSRSSSLGAEGLLGMMACSGKSPDDVVSWKEIRVTPDGAAPPAPNPASPTNGTTLPAPWLYSNIVNPGLNGSAQWTDSELKMSFPAAGDGSNGRSYGYVYRPVQGDAEIVAKLDVQPRTDARRMGLVFRSSLDNDADEIEFYSDGLGGIGFDMHTHPGDQSLRYFKKVAVLAPNNQAILIALADQLASKRKYGQACDLYALALKANMSSGLQNYNNVVMSFEGANRLPELVKLIVDWNPAAPNPMIGGMDSRWLIVQIAGLLKDKNHYPEAEQIYRKALTIDSTQPNQDVVDGLVDILIEEKRDDEAGVEIEKWLLNKDTPASKPPPVLGFNVAMQNQLRNNWFQFLSWNQDGNISSPLIHFLEMADNLGLSKKLRTELQVKLGQKPKITSSVAQADPDRLTIILLAILARDPSYRLDMEKLLKEYPTSSFTTGLNATAFLILSQQLAKWPEESPMALRVAKQVQEGSSRSNGSFRNIAGYQVVRIQQQLGDHKALQVTLRDLAATITEARSTNVNAIQLDQVFMVVNWLLEEGMVKEAGDLLDNSKNDPQLTAGNNYYTQRMVRVQADLDAARNGSTSLFLSYGLSPETAKEKGKGDKVLFFWQLNNYKPDNKNPASNMIWNDRMASRPTSCQIAIKAGPDEQHLAPVTELKNVATNGSKSITVPAGTRMIRAMLANGKPAAKPTVVPAGASLPALVANGYSMVFTNQENLLKNPDFKVTKDDAGKQTVAGWQHLIPLSVTVQKGGPMPGGSYQILDGDFNRRGEALSEPIPVLPNTTYVFSGWFKRPAVLYHFLDADKKPLNNNFGDYGDNEASWSWRAKVFHSGTGDNLPNDMAFPPKAAYIQIGLRLDQERSVAGLSFRVLPPAVIPTAPPPTASAPPKKAVAPATKTVPEKAK